MGLLQPGIDSLQSWGVHTELGAPELCIGKRFPLLEILEHSLTLSQHHFGVNVCCWLIQLPHPLAGWQRHCSLLSSVPEDGASPQSHPSSRGGCELDTGSHKMGLCDGWSTPRLLVSPWLFFCSC